jgi:hypothetical protein
MKRMQGSHEQCCMYKSLHASPPHPSPSAYCTSTFASSIQRCLPLEPLEPFAYLVLKSAHYVGSMGTQRTAAGRSPLAPPLPRPHLRYPPVPQEGAPPRASWASGLEGGGGPPSYSHGRGGGWSASSCNASSGGSATADNACLCMCQLVTTIYIYIYTYSVCVCVSP